MGKEKVKVCKEKTERESIVQIVGEFQELRYKTSDLKGSQNTEVVVHNKAYSIPVQLKEDPYMCMCVIL